MVKKNKHLICIVGPTASGKTSIGIEIANHFNTEILSADSRQMYNQMSIGTAKPTKKELAAAKHHFVNNLNLWDDYSAGDFEREGIEKLSQIYSEKDIAVIVGGSGLFVKAITEGFDDIPAVPDSIRTQLIGRFEESGLTPLQSQLKQLDPAQFETMDIQNHQRVIRALEVCIGTGKPYSSFKGIKKSDRQFTPIVIGMEWPREELYNRINKRVDLMMEQGLESEVKITFRLLGSSCIKNCRVPGVPSIF